MIVISYAWTLTVRHVVTEIDIGAYADNWGWSTRHANLHTPIVDATVQYTQFCGMAIDWHKTWIWSTAKSHLPALQRAIANHAGQSMVKVLTHEMDLGAPLTYRGPQNLEK